MPASSSEHGVIRHRRDFAVGAAYIVAGLGFAVASSRHELGSLAHIGPGFFPLCLAFVLIGLGAIVARRAIGQQAASVPLEPWDLRSLGWMTGSVLLFGLALKPLGLVLAVALLVVASSLASPAFRWRATLLNAAALVVLTVGGFVFGLSLPLPVWPSFLSP